MSRTIISTYDYIQNIIDRKGDGILPVGQDPFILDQHHGASVEAWSINDHFLTWSYLEDAIVGMYNALYLRGKYKTTIFTVWDAPFGMMGTGCLREGDAVLSLRNVTNGGRIEAFRT